MPAHLKPFDGAVFRANPFYQLAAVGRTRHREKQFFSASPQHSLPYAILHPQPRCGLFIKTVCRQTADLFASLETPGLVAARFGAAGDLKRRRDLARLVWDGVIEIEYHGAFLSGAAACEPIAELDTNIPARGPLGRLSLEAVRHGEALASLDIPNLTNRLYGYHRKPIVPSIRGRLRSPSDVFAWLCPPASRVRATLERAWIDASSHTPGGWLAWSKHSASPGHARSPTYKLYISPDEAVLPEVFSRAVQVLTDSPAFAVKIANDRNGLARADKCLAYFRTPSELRETASHLGSALRGFPVHGVPFTAAIRNGLLSWGVDPPRASDSWSTPGMTSWRFWIASRLATALISAKSMPKGAIERWRFALERLRLDGVDPEWWRPEPGLWDDLVKIETTIP